MHEFLKKNSTFVNVSIKITNMGQTLLKNIQKGVKVHW